MNLTRVRLVLVLVLAGLVAAGCASIRKDQRATTLLVATKGYESALRWGYHETAFGYLPPDVRKGKEPPPVLKSVRVTGYEVVQPSTLSGKFEEATQVVAIDYVHEDRQVVKQVTDRQLWRYDPKLDTWWLSSGLPRFE
jgi:hypothetical protein